MPLLDEHFSQLEVIVDFSVEYDANLSVFVPHRLVASLDVENGQPAVREEYPVRTVDVRTLSVRSPVDHRIAHRQQVLPVSRADKAGDPAHLLVTRQVDGVLY